jgi:hypothetical protein
MKDKIYSFHGKTMILMNIRILEFLRMVLSCQYVELLQIPVPGYSKVV